ncbi:Uncharacterised protein g3167 [Pycnogonum litorale]
MNAGQFLNGISIIITLIAPSLLCAIWFPAYERVTATSIIAFACSFGTMLSFLVGLSVTDEGFVNSTHHHHSKSKLFAGNHSAENAHKKERDGRDIMMIMYSEFGISVFLFLAVITYFPNRPKLPPSISASFSRPSFVAGFKDLLKNKNMWLLTISSALTFGVNGNLITLLAIVLKQVNVTQRQSQFMGMYSMIASTFLPIIMGRIADRANKVLKSLLGFCWLVMVIGTILLLLMGLHYIPHPIYAVYIVVIAINAFSGISYPLMWQLGCEITYPSSEGSTLGVLYLGQNIIGAIFLFLFKIPHIGVLWVLYACAGTALLGFIIFLPIKVHYHRSNLDTSGTSSSGPSRQYGSINA